LRLLLDEMLTPRVAVALREHGVDALAIQELPSLLGKADPHLLHVGRETRRVVVTNNVRDFRMLQRDAHAAGAWHQGIILIPSTMPCSRRGVGRMVLALAAVAAAHPGDDDLRDRELWL
jgi:hypothetical protein